MDIINDLLATVNPQQEQRIHDRMMLAARIADALDAKGWAQKDLAIKLNKQPSEISKWLSGTHNFTIDTLSDLSHVLGVKLLCVKEEPKPVARQVARYERIAIASYRQESDLINYESFQTGIVQPSEHHETQAH
ncbi:helix-turn-helix domain-containing protein [Fibrella aquatilis]|uniref:Helix-turn-helix transcriptional regulator n=1 Tax=Fibrella aquatilis TaxID=2817059 RepID=A0A939G339_9BACT|nr:helix-turn-helix transcriptional regulator [Fibrella aquatilis]MBO0930200.1 helix-turn-helix transcriptional regulator [Fibrella aquatilis]